MRTPRIVVALLPLVASAPTLAQPLGTAFTYQGELRASGVPATGPHDLRFRLYDAASGGNQVGSTICSDNIATSEGRFTVVLDFGAQFAGAQRFLEIEVRADTGLDCGNAAGFVPLAPRQPLTASPHAIFALSAGSAATANDATQLNGQSAAYYRDAANLNAGTVADARLASTVARTNTNQAFTGAMTFGNAGNAFTGAFSGSGAGLTGVNADLLDGLDSTAFLQSIPIPLTLSGGSMTHIIRGENAALASGSAGVYGISTASTTVAYGVYGRSASASGCGVRGEATAVNGINFGGWFSTPSTSGMGVSGIAGATNGDTFGVYGESASTNGIGVRGVATSTSGTTQGGLFESRSPAGVGVEGLATTGTGATAGVRGESVSSSGMGVSALASNTTGSNFGVFARSNSTSGIGVFGRVLATTGATKGIHGVSDSTSGIGVSGLAAATTGTTYGVYGESVSTSGVGGFFVGRGSDALYVRNDADGRGIQVLAPNDTAIWAITTAGIAGVDGRNASTTGRGVYGYATASTGTNYGVYGRTASGSGYGVYSLGNTGASGTKSFQIDHPLDPENKYLLHYSTESPEVLNAYSGKVTLDGAGEAIVELPAYFASINKDPRYTLTAVGAPMPMLHVAEEISEAALKAGEAAGPGVAPPICSFRIGGGAPGGKVSWRVEAVRNDLRVRLHGAPVEREKAGPERGKYQHPEYYGQPPERGIDFHAADEPYTHETVSPDPPRP